MLFNNLEPPTLAGVSAALVMLASSRSNDRARRSCSVYFFRAIKTSTANGIEHAIPQIGNRGAYPRKRLGGGYSLTRFLFCAAGRSIPTGNPGHNGIVPMVQKTRFSDRRLSGLTLFLAKGIHSGRGNASDIRDTYERHSPLLLRFLCDDLRVVRMTKPFPAMIPAAWKGM